jgi:hypothetical protein
MNPSARLSLVHLIPRGSSSRSESRPDRGAMLACACARLPCGRPSFPFACGPATLSPREYLRDVPLGNLLSTSIPSASLGATLGTLPPPPLPAPPSSRRYRQHHRSGKVWKRLEPHPEAISRPSGSSAEIHREIRYRYSRSPVEVSPAIDAPSNSANDGSGVNNDDREERNRRKRRGREETSKNVPRASRANWKKEEPAPLSRAANRRDKSLLRKQGSVRHRDVS